MARVFIGLIGVALTSVLLVIAMPPMNQYYVGWFALFPLFFAVRGIGFAAAFILGLLAAICAAVISANNPLLPNFLEYGNNGWTYVGYALLGLLIGIAAGVFGVARPVKLRYAILFAAGAVLLEAATMLLLPVHLGLSQYKSAGMMTLASVTGIWGVSFLVWLSNIALASTKTRRTGAIIAAVGIAAYFVPFLPVEKSGRRVAAIQTAVEFERLHAEASKANPDIVVWPELAGMSFCFGDDTTKLNQLSSSSAAFATSYQDGCAPKPHNVLAIFEKGRARGHYEKRKLFAAEKDIHAPGSKAAATGAYGLNICFDSCYPAIICETASMNGVEVIVLPTLDPDSSNGVVQSSHAAYSTFRAAECGVPIARSETTAYSGIVDSSGRILTDAGTAQNAVVSAEVGKPKWTFYKLAGDWFLYACGAYIIGLPLALRLRRK